MKKVIALAALTLPLMFLWFPFKDIDQRVDVFVFIEHQEKPKWIAHDVGWFLTNIILMFGIHFLVREQNRRLAKLTLVLLIFAIFRLLEYFLYRGHIPMIPIVGGILIYSLGTLYYKK